MGDEVRHTQRGNNNAYCQDNETSWFDWTLVAKHTDVNRFVTLLIERRLRRSTEHERRRVSLNQLISEANKEWHGTRLHQPDWGPWSRSLALSVEVRKQQLRFHLIMNAYWEPLDFELPSPDKGEGQSWRRWIDTALESPHDIVPWQQAVAVPGQTYRAEARSVVALLTGAESRAND
jgi:glycogen operon protein